MPKKTKREKLFSDHHRTQMIISPQPTFQFRVQESTHIHADQAHQVTSDDLTGIQNDLLKTVILAMMAIGSEIILAKLIR